MDNDENLEFSVPDSSREALRGALRALYGHDLLVARRELDWVENNLDADPAMPLIAHYLRGIVEDLSTIG